MKQFLLIILLSLSIGLQINAQITLSNETFPTIGDTLFTAIDNLPSNISITPSGGGQSWDFTSLQSPFSRRVVYRAAEEGTSGDGFPAANIFTDLGEGIEAYYRSTANTFELIGLYGMDPLELQLEILSRFDPVIIERRAPLDFFDVNQMEAALLLAFSADDIPSDILDQFPITPDSLRIRIAIDRLDLVDAWGTLTIPGGIYDVLREKRTEIRETRLDAKISVLPWQDITDIIIELLPEEVGNFLGKDTIITYNFFSDEVKEPIAIVTVDNENETPNRVEYKANDITSNVQSIEALQPGVYAFPNPAIVNVRFEFSNLPKGKYNLKIYNILGIEVWSKRYFINGFLTEKVDISSLRRGTYLYSLVDERGKTLTTRRLIVVRP